MGVLHILWVDVGCGKAIPACGFVLSVGFLMLYCAGVHLTGGCGDGSDDWVVLRWRRFSEVFLIGRVGWK